MENSSSDKPIAKDALLLSLPLLYSNLFCKLTDWIFLRHKASLRESFVWALDHAACATCVINAIELKMAILNFACNGLIALVIAIIFFRIDFQSKQLGLFVKIQSAILILQFGASAYSTLSSFGAFKDAYTYL